jgi:hypothetical protein
MKNQEQSYVCRLRTLTRKSIIGFGKYKDLTVQNVLDTMNVSEIIGLYFRLDKINFQEEILEEVGIKKELRIQKPGKAKKEEADILVKKALSNFYENKEVLSEWLKNNSRKTKTKKMTKSFNKRLDNKLYNKESLRSKNHNTFKN